MEILNVKRKSTAAHLNNLIDLRVHPSVRSGNNRSKICLWVLKKMTPFYTQLRLYLPIPLKKKKNILEYLAVQA